MLHRVKARISYDAKKKKKEKKIESLAGKKAAAYCKFKGDEQREEDMKIIRIMMN